MKIKNSAFELVIPVIGFMDNPDCFPGTLYKGAKEMPLPRYTDAPTEEALICELVGRQRVNMSFLLNSNGGDVEVYETYKRFMGAVRKRNGVVRAYAPQRAGSAAAWIFAEADQRYVQPQTQVMFHLRVRRKFVPQGQVRVFSPALMLDLVVERGEYESVPHEESREADREKVRRFLLQGTPANDRVKVEAVVNQVFNDPANERDEIAMTGATLHQLGKATALNSRDLRRQFEKNTGLNVQRDTFLNRVWTLLNVPDFA